MSTTHLHPGPELKNEWGCTSNPTILCLEGMDRENFGFPLIRPDKSNLFTQSVGANSRKSVFSFTGVLISP